MNDMPNITWTQVISNFLWILGASIILAAFSYHEFLAYIQKNGRAEVYKRKSFKKPFRIGLVLIAIGIFASSLFYIFSPQPEAIIVKDTVNFPPSSFAGRRVIEGERIVMPWGGIIKSKIIKFEKSKYTIQITSKGSNVLGETSQLKVYIGTNLVADYFTSTEFKEKAIEFNIKKNMIQRLIIEFPNFYEDPEKNLQRKVWIRSITIAKMYNIPN